MKMVVAIIQPHRLEDVRTALSAIDVHGMTASEVQGYGRQSGQKEIYRGAEYEVHFVPKIKVEIAISDDLEDQVIEGIQTAARTGRIGDGKIFVFDLGQTVRIRTGEKGVDAL